MDAIVDRDGESENHTRDEVVETTAPAPQEPGKGSSGLLLVADNYDAFAARALAARSAKTSLDLMYYLWHDDHTGRLLTQEVVKAADRGVRVRMLLDDINPQHNDSVYLALNSHPNISLRLFNPSAARNSRILRALELASHLFALTRRMHNKAWIADDEIAIVGGRNIGDAYFNAAETNFRDLDLLLLGKAVGETREIFEQFWNCKAAKPIQELNPVKPDRKARKAVLEGVDHEDNTLLLSGLRDRASIADFVTESDEIVWTNDARVISDPPEKATGRRRRNWLMKELMPIIETARKELEIISPYFIPGRRGCSVLAALVGRGVDVEVLTNSLAATDVAAVHGAYANYRARLLKQGVKLFELQPFDREPKISVFGSKGASLHTKAFTVDDAAGFIGSFNFDPRSVSLNTEMGVLFHDARLVADLRRRFQLETSPQTSYRLILDAGRLAWEGEDNGGMVRYRREPEAGFLRRLIAGVVRWLPIESQL